MAFRRRYWNRCVKNGSRDLNFDRWNAKSRKAASQMVPNTTNMVRSSIGFRTINIDHVVNKCGAPNMDSRSMGTSLRDISAGADSAAIPEDFVAAYEDGIPAGGVAILKTEMTDASAS